MERLKLNPTPIVQRVNVELLDGDTLISNKVLMGETIIIKGRDMLVDLIMFDTLNFGMILKVNFLEKYGIDINCYRN